MHLLILAQNTQQLRQTQSAGALFGSLCVFVFVLVILAFLVFVWGTIFKKAGYSFWLGLLMIVPLANLVWILIFAFSVWPIQQELESLRRGGGPYPGGFPVQPPRR